MNNKYSTNTSSQRQRILGWLRKNSSLTTLEARIELDIFHPSARVQELRAQGYNIVTHTETIDSGKGKHRIAKYVLFASGGANG